YRRLWEQHVIRARSGEITQLAVAEVLARRLWSYPRVPGDVDVLPHQLKDTVSRALSGRLLSRSTLSLFIDAFRVSHAAAQRRPPVAALGGLGHDQRLVRAPGGDGPDRAGTAGRHRPAPPPDAVPARSRHRGPRGQDGPHAHPAGRGGDRGRAGPDSVPV